MRIQYGRAFVVLVAGLVTLIANMKAQRPVNESLLIVLIVICVFYFISTLLMEIMQKLGESKKEEEPESADEEESKEDAAKDVQISFDEEDAE